jgi:hypothetical protein
MPIPQSINSRLQCACKKGLFEEIHRSKREFRHIQKIGLAPILQGRARNEEDRGFGMQVQNALPKPTHFGAAHGAGRNPMIRDPRLQRADQGFWQKASNRRLFRQQRT